MSLRPSVRDLALVSVLYFAGVKLSMLTVAPEGIAIVWLPTAVVLAALIRFRAVRLRLLGLVVVATEVAAGLPAVNLGEALLLGLIHFGEATLAFVLLRRLDFDARAATLADAWKFLVAGPLAAAFAASLFSAAVYAAFRAGEATYPQLLRSAWFADGIGLLLLTPLLLAFAPFGEAPETPAARWRPRPADAVLLAAAALAVALFWFSDSFGFQLRPFLFVPVALVAAARYPQRWAPLVAALVAVAVVCAIAAGLEPFGPLPPREAAVTAQGFLFIVTLTTLGFAALLGELRRHKAELLARVAERTRELQLANERLAHLAAVDPLTGVGNRRLFDQALAVEMGRARRYAEPLSLVLADLDHFKRVNDTRGHAAGDEVLREVGRALRECARGADVVARYGGEEFAIILPHTTLAQALRFAERARRAISGLPAGVTASFGAAQLGPQDEAAQLAAAADAALYRAKAEGRDRVRAAEPLVV
ncbi:MAG TPA: diguanylate cyclase [Burkholderiales bacterium]|nr:diguanylate cyclase [Burkholderiales bacterium]